MVDFTLDDVDTPGPDRFGGLRIRLSWRNPWVPPAYSISQVDGARRLVLASGHLQGDLQLLAQLLRAPLAPYRAATTRDHAPLALLQALLDSTADLAGLREDLDCARAMARVVMERHDDVLPVYVSADWHLSVERWSWLVRAGAESRAQPAQALEVVTVPPGRRREGATSRHGGLPLIVACPADLAAPLARADWYVRDPELMAHLLRLYPGRGPIPPVAGAHIVIAHAAGDVTARDLGRWLRAGADGGTIRVVVDAAPGLDIAARQAAGVATVRLTRGTGRPPLQLNRLLEALAQDRPLHAAVHAARNIDAAQRARSVFDAVAPWIDSARLYATPRLDHWLQQGRPGPALDQHALDAQADQADARVTFLASALGPHVSAPAAQRLQLQLRDIGDADARLRSALARSAGGTGLRPQAQVLAERDALQRRQRQFEVLVEDLLRNPDTMRALEQAQERRIDATLARRRARGTYAAVARRRTLAYGAAVRLTVHVGQRGRDSLVQGQVPALDALLAPLGDGETHMLDIVVFPKDFALAPHEPALRSVRLGRFGGTGPVSWDLLAPLHASALASDLDQAGAAPLEDTSRGRGWVAGAVAELRFGVYLGNQLLQSFTLRAPLGAGNRPSDDSVVIACDFSQTRNFARLDCFKPRALSLALNCNPNGTHTLMIKGAVAGGAGAGTVATGSVLWSAGFLSNYVAAARTALLAATMDHAGNGRFGFDAATLAVDRADPAAFQDAVRAMAEAGSNLYTQLCMNPGAGAGTQFNMLRPADGDTVQIVLHDSSYALPWGLLYDYDLPAVAPGQILPVCTGQVGGQPCNCAVTPSGPCLRGFWGFRLTIEQLAEAPPHQLHPDGSIDVAPAPAPAPTLGHICTVPADAYLQQLPWNPACLPRFSCVDLGTGQILASLQAAVPAVVLYIGHQGNGATPAAPMPALLASDQTPILRLSDINRAMQQQQKWTAPRPLVLLMGCGTATTRPDTGVSLAGALLKLGATGVMGTECDVATAMVARVAHDLIGRLANGEWIGTALKEIIWTLAQEGCPAGLAFSYLGPVKARVVL